MSQCDPIGERVRVHFHIPTKLWSVSTKTGWASTWRVVRDRKGRQVLYSKVVLKDVLFDVRESGRQRTIREGRKNVHAWMEGELLHASRHERTATVPCGVHVSYNPYKYTSFVTKPDEEPIVAADFAAAGCENGVLVPSWGVVRPDPVLEDVG
jgi:hypothetical protein